MGFKIVACALLAAMGTVQARKGAGTSLDPIQPVLLPDGDKAKNPLAHLGGNGPWTAGMALSHQLIHICTLLTFYSARRQWHLLRRAKQLLC